MQIIRSLWDYRSFIMGSVKREFSSKYTNSLLGMTWAVLQPLSMVVVYTVIFSQIMQAKLPGVSSVYGYSIYLCAGILTWGLFSEVVSRSQTIFLDNASLIKKMRFPRMCLPIIVILSSLLNFSIIFFIFIVFLLASGMMPGVEIFSILPVLLIQLIFSIGLGITLGVLNVFFRDVGQGFTIILQFWFWLTPIVYPAAVLPESFRKYMEYNPMAPIIGAYQDILVHGESPQFISLLPMTVVSIIFLVLGFYTFRKFSADIVDEL